MRSVIASTLLLLLSLTSTITIQAEEVFIGSFTTRQHQVSGDIYALSERVLEVRNFVFDGFAPAAFFWADKGNVPSSNGYILQDGAPSNSCGSEELPGASGETYRVEFPEGLSILDFAGGSISVWCEAFSANFGEVVVPDSLPGLTATADGPALTCSTRGGNGEDAVAEPLVLGDFITRQHQVSGQVVALTDRIIEIRNFVFDGNAPAAFFWATSTARPSSSGFILQDGAPSNSCGSTKLPGASGETFRVEFPEGNSLRDIPGGSISVWCEAFSANFGEIVLPETFEGLGATSDGGPALQCSDPPSGTAAPDFVITPNGMNCEPLHDDLQVRWKVNGDQLDVELVGRVEKEGVYMGFGPSGRSDATDMIGADPVICDFFNGEYRAVDYYMNARAQCAAADGVCPDTDSSLPSDVSNVSGDSENGFSVIRYSRPLVPSNLDSMVGGETSDLSINVEPGAMTYIVWAIGPIDNDTGNALFHSIAFGRENTAIEFGRSVQDNCEPFTVEEEEEEEILPFFRPIITDTTEFTARIGPSGGPRGYETITGEDAWGISWYINDVLIPVIEMRRGTTYTFRVNGGDNPETNSEYHPLYLTESVEGGYLQKSVDERAQESVITGLNFSDDGSFEPTAAGPLCVFQVTESTNDALLSSYPEYDATLDKSCASDESLNNAAGILEFTPDENTPDLIYYQCVTHRSLGWEIHVIDADAESAVNVDCSTFSRNRVDLIDGLYVNTIIDPNAMTLKVEMVYEGQGWLGFAFTSGQALMVDAEAVIGLPDEEGGPSKYDMNSRSVAGVQRMADEKQTLRDGKITQNNTHTVMTFTKLLVEDGEHPISSDGENVFLYAVGSGNDLAYHASRGSFALNVGQCQVFIDGVLTNPGSLQEGATAPSGADNRRSLWMTHGILAATAWAILVPLAVGSSLIRDVLHETLGLSAGTWFQLHRTLNGLALLCTVVAFGIAVYLFDDLGVDHFRTLTHHTLGLVIFILAIVQSLGGIFRPHLPHPVDESQVDKEAGVTQQQADEESPSAAVEKTEEKDSRKTIARIAFEIGHRVLGVALLGMSWWQVQNGWGLFADRFNEDSLQSAWWGILGGICGLVGLIYAYQTFTKKH